jgi:predicted enzyme related to lactoylglutathione lyase
MGSPEVWSICRPAGNVYDRVIGEVVGLVSLPDYGAGTRAGCAGRTRQGVNAHLPACWLMYIIVENLQESIDACRSLGGRVIDGPGEGAGNRWCVIQDPVGAYVALYQSGQ